MSHMNPAARPESFDDAVRIYESIKPIKGKVGALDIRPLGRRGNQAERIIKLDEHTYALWPSSHWWNKKETFNKEDARIRAAVLWQRTDGGDFISVRNDWYAGGHGTHYRFLTEVLPKGLYFVNQSGKQYILNEAKLTKHYLPHDRWTGGSRQGQFIEEDNKQLTPAAVFRQDGVGKFTFVGQDYVAPKKAVNKEAKAAMLPHIRAFKEWALALAPMLNLKPRWAWPENPTSKLRYNEYTAQQRADSEAILVWAATKNIVIGRTTIDCVDPKYVREVVQDDQHVMRVVLANHVLNACIFRSLEQSVREAAMTESEARKRFNASFNYHMNQLLGLVEEK